MPLRKRFFGVLVAALVGVCAALALSFQVWIFVESEASGPDVRPSVQIVMKACVLWSKVTGDYWEDEMLRQAKLVASLPLSQRVDFYREIVVHCDLDTSRAFLFVEMVGNDVGSLQQDLAKFKDGKRFHSLSTKRRKHVEDWIEELQAISESPEH